MVFNATGYNAKMQMKFGVVLWVVLMLALASCAAGDMSLPTIVPLPTDTPLITLSPSATLAPTNTLAPSPTLAPTLTPTPEPVTYTVTDDDDMFGVALRFGVSLEMLKTANPSVIPNLMSVGTVLIIPITPTPVVPGTIQETPVKTPDPFSQLRLAMAPICYEDALGGAYCFAQLENISESPVENPSVLFTLTGADADSQVMDGILPLNILPAGETLPVVAYFPAPLPDSFEVSAQIQDWLPVMEDDDRYLSVQITQEQPVYTENASFIEANGTVSLSSGEADYLWVLGVIYGEDGQVLGLRRWEAEAPLSAGISVPYSFRIYAMHGEIVEIKMFAEAHANNP